MWVLKTEYKCSVMVMVPEWLKEEEGGGETVQKEIFPAYIAF